MHVFCARFGIADIDNEQCLIKISNLCIMRINNPYCKRIRINDNVTICKRLVRVEKDINSLSLFFSCCKMAILQS